MTFFYLFLVTLLLSFIIEKLTLPALACHTLSQVLLKIALISFIFGLVLLITRRPFFSVLITFSLELLLIVVSNTKFKTLKEPLVFSDIILYAQVFQFPRLFLPFLSLGALLGIIFGILFLIIFLIYEDPLVFNFYLLSVLVFVLFMSPFLIVFLSQKITVEIDPIIDIKKQGLLNLLIIYFIQNLLDKKEINFPYQNNNLKTKPLAQTIVCIQSESFFDARRLSPCIKQNLLPAFEQCKTTADYYGELEVPAWGANTMRTEFSFLTGLNNQELRFKKFYPHFFYKNKAIPSLISALKAQNYYTLCIHPHPAQFFQRGAFFKQLGFDEFIDINAFSKNQKSGPYIGDKAITEKIKQVLEIHSNKKLFIFAITMENHGPLHLETILDNESGRYLNQAQTTPLLNDLIIYLRHLNNADQMIKDLLDELKAKDGLCCFYGDHLPNMNAIFQQFEFENNKTDYFISLSKQRSNIKKQITIEQLSGLFF